jgi:hypothetical protein
MKITREELEFRVQRTLDNYYNYSYTQGELLREETQYYYLVRDLRIFKSEGGDVFDFRDSFLLNLVHNTNLKEEQEDFIFDLVDSINGNCPVNRII